MTPTHQFRMCQACDQSRPPEGGIQLSRTRWVCASCWHKFRR